MNRITSAKAIFAGCMAAAMVAFPNVAHADTQCVRDAEGKYKLAASKIRIRETRIDAEYKKGQIRCGQTGTKECYRALTNTAELKRQQAEMDLTDDAADRQARIIQCSVSESAVAEPAPGQDNGKPVGAMTGSVLYNGVTLFVDTKAGRVVGQGFQGPVEFRSNPPKFSRAEGFITGTKEFTITRLWDQGGAEVPVGSGVKVPKSQR